jgi:hypothetical protein
MPDRLAQLSHKTLTHTPTGFVGRQIVPSSRPGPRPRARARSVSCTRSPLRKTVLMLATGPARSRLYLVSIREVLIAAGVF